LHIIPHLPERLPLWIGAVSDQAENAATAKAQIARLGFFAVNRGAYSFAFCEATICCAIVRPVRLVE
jgi:hypothetical protein